MKLDQILSSVGRKMLIDFEHTSGQVKHSGGKGRLRESTVAKYARRWLPKTVSVGGPGEIVTCHGSRSPECDVLVFDPNTPPLIDEQDFMVLPAECLYGVLQVKSQLNRAELRQDYEVIRKAKSLEKTAYMLPSSPLVTSSTVYGKEWSYFPTWGCIFAYESMSLQAIRSELESLDERTPLEQRPDIVVVLSKGLVVNARPDGLLGPWCEQEGMRVAIESDNPLMLMTLSMQQVMTNAWMPEFDMKKYLEHVNFGTALLPYISPSNRLN